MAIDYSGLISEGGRAAISSLGDLPPDQRRAKMNDMLANGLLPFSVALAVDKQLNNPMKQNAPSPRPGSVMSEKMQLLQQTGGGIDQLPAPSMDQAQFAGGGIVAFDEGGNTGYGKAFDPFAGLEIDPKDPLAAYYSYIRKTSSPSYSLDEIRRQGQSEREAAGVGGAHKAYGDVLKSRRDEYSTASDEDKADARRAGWLAMAQAGAEGKGILEGGIRGLTKNAEINEAKKKERKAELRELQKEEYSLQLAMEQAKMSGNKEDFDRYVKLLGINQQTQEAIGRGLLTGAEMKSRERTAAADRAVQQQKDAIDIRYANQIRDIEAKMDRAIGSELEYLKAQREEVLGRWGDAKRAVGAASVYGADKRREAAGIGPYQRLVENAYNMKKAQLSAAEAALKLDPDDPEKQRMIVELKQDIAEIEQNLFSGGSPNVADSSAAGVLNFLGNQTFSNPALPPGLAPAPIAGLPAAPAELPPEFR